MVMFEADRTWKRKRREEAQGESLEETQTKSSVTYEGARWERMESIKYEFGDEIYRDGTLI